MASIVSLSELTDWLFPPGDTSSADDAKLQRCLDAATRVIEQAAGRKFELDSTDQTYYVYANAQGEIELADIVSITTLKIDTNGDRTYATTLAATDYELLPYNEARKQRIRIWPTSSRSFTAGRLVQLVGRRGYVVGGRAPADVQQACLLLASRYYNRKGAPFGVLESTSLGQFERLSAEDPDVAALLKPYIHGAAGREWVMV